MRSQLRFSYETKERLMADDKSWNAASARVEVARHTPEVEPAEKSDQETLQAEAHRAGVEAVARALDQAA